MASSTSESSWAPLPEVITTARLTLRPWQLDDVDDVLSYAQDEEWSRYLRALPRPYGRSDAEQFIARQILLDRASHPSWAVCSEGSVIGGLNLRVFSQHQLVEIGYSIARLHWNKGVCTEAAGAVIDAAFENCPELNRIRAMADVANTASQRVMEKLGMTKEGVLRQNRVERGYAIDEAWWGLLRSEWSAQADR